MTTIAMRVASGLGLSGLLVAGGVGCASQSKSPPAGSLTASQPAALDEPGVQRTAGAVEGLQAMSEQLVKQRENVTQMLAALQDLSTAQGDLLEPFQRFITLHAAVDEGDEQLVSQGEEMRAKARDYITNWEVEVYGVEDTELRTQAENRRSRVRADYGRISDMSRALRESMSGFQQQLNDLRTFLGNDLTPAGVRAAAPSIAKASQSGTQVQTRIDALLTELDRVAAAMQPLRMPSTNPGEAVNPK